MDQIESLILGFPKSRTVSSRDHNPFRKKQGISRTDLEQTARTGLTGGGVVKIKK